MGHWRGQPRFICSEADRSEAARSLARATYINPCIRAVTRRPPENYHGEVSLLISRVHVSFATATTKNMTHITATEPLADKCSPHLFTSHPVLFISADANVHGHINGNAPPMQLLGLSSTVVMQSKLKVTWPFVKQDWLDGAPYIYSRQANASRDPKPVARDCMSPI